MVAEHALVLQLWLVDLTTLPLSALRAQHVYRAPRTAGRCVCACSASALQWLTACACLTVRAQKIVLLLATRRLQALELNTIGLPIGLELPVQRDEDWRAVRVRE